jgi:hypothetical protein
MAHRTSRVWELRCTTPTTPAKHQPLHQTKMNARFAAQEEKKYLYMDTPNAKFV